MLVSVCMHLSVASSLLVADLFLGLMFLTWFPFSLERFLSFYFLLLVFLLRCKQIFCGTTMYFVVWSKVQSNEPYCLSIVSSLSLSFLVLCSSRDRSSGNISSYALVFLSVLLSLHMTLMMVMTTMMKKNTREGKRSQKWNKRQGYIDCEWLVFRYRSSLRRTHSAWGSFLSASIVMHVVFLRSFVFSFFSFIICCRWRQSEERRNETKRHSSVHSWPFFLIRKTEEWRWVHTSRHDPPLSILVSHAKNKTKGQRRMTPFGKKKWEGILLCFYA